MNVWTGKEMEEAMGVSYQSPTCGGNGETTCRVLGKKDTRRRSTGLEKLEGLSVASIAGGVMIIGLQGVLQVCLVLRGSDICAK